MTKNTNVAPVPAELITEHIFIVRGQKVILDSDLAALYEVPTKRFNEAVKRNAAKFPADFMFTLTSEEFASLRSQIATSNSSPGSGGRRYSPFVFTEHGAIMAATLLNSSRAIDVSVYVVRAFVQQRELLASNKDLARQLRALEQRLEKKLGSHDQAIAGLIDTLRQLMAPPDPPKRPIGFTVPAERTTKDSKTGKVMKPMKSSRQK
jgi:ORF6N domain